MFTGAEKLKTTIQPQKDQTEVTVYKTKDQLIYHVQVEIDEESYVVRNGKNFFTTTPILPKEHLRIQELMESEKRTRALFCISYQDIESKQNTIVIDRDELLHAFLLIKK